MPTFPRESEFDAMIAQAAARHEVPFPLVKAIVAAESGFSPTARRGEPGGVTSWGLMQVTPAAAWGTGAHLHDESELLDPATNVDRGAAFLASLYRQLGRDEERAASAYNGGNRPSLGFGTKLTRDLLLCLAWKPGAPPAGSGRTIERDCAQPYSARAGEFGNQPYVNKVMGYRRQYAGPLTLTSHQAGAVAAAALGVAVLVLARR